MPKLEPETHSTVKERYKALVLYVKNTLISQFNYHNWTFIHKSALYSILTWLSNYDGSPVLCILWRSTSWNICPSR